MSPSLASCRHMEDGAPRASGDEPIWVDGVTGLVTCAPRERG